MKRLGVVCAGLIFLAGCSNANSDSIGDPPFQKPKDECAGKVVANEYVVQWKSGAVTKEYAADDETFVEDFVAENKAEIEIAEPNYRVSLPNKVDSVQASAITQADNWGQARIQADKVWQQGVRGSGVIVAVIDTGVDRNHPQLKNQLALNAGEMGTDNKGKNKASNGLDDDGNGYVDDWNGVNLIDGSGNPTDDNGHGTHVAGIIAAEHNDTIAKPANRVQGVAPAAKILPLKFLDHEGNGNTDHAVPAIDYAVARGARVINASWGGDDCSLVLKQKIQSLIAKNVLFVAAAGNEGIDLDVSGRFPANFDFLSQITIGSTGMYDNMSYFSNYSSTHVHVFAPGELIVSTYPGGNMAALSGTSMAAPMFAGAAALAYSYNPDVTLSQLRDALLQSVVVNIEYHNQSQGRLNLSSMLAHLPAP